MFLQTVTVIQKMMQAILPNIGMFASFDPVALDQACADACLKADPMPNSQLSDNLEKPDWHHHHDHFMVPIRMCVGRKRSNMQKRLDLEIESMN